MIISGEEVWRAIQNHYPEIKALAVKAGVEHNYKRARQLQESNSYVGGYRIAQTEAERDLAIGFRVTFLDEDAILSSAEDTFRTAMACVDCPDDL